MSEIRDKVMLTAGMGEAGLGRDREKETPRECVYVWERQRGGPFALFS